MHRICRQKEQFQPDIPRFDVRQLMPEDEIKLLGRIVLARQKNRRTKETDCQRSLDIRVDGKARGAAEC